METVSRNGRNVWVLRLIRPSGPGQDQGNLVDQQATVGGHVAHHFDIVGAPSSRKPLRITPLPSLLWTPCEGHRGGGGRTNLLLALVIDRHKGGHMQYR